MSAQELREAAEAVRETCGLTRTGYIGLSTKLAAALADWLESTSIHSRQLDGRSEQELDPDLGAALEFARMVLAGRDRLERQLLEKPKPRPSLDPDDVFGPNRDGGA